jgi:competence protein ComEA
MQRIFILMVAFFAWCGVAFGAVDLNVATQAELETLPGIGPSKAIAILQYREQNGPFATVDALDNVPGIGPSTMANVRALVTVGAQSAASPTTTSAPATAVATTTTAAPASSGGAQVNINTADAKTLETMPGIGPSKAAAILEYRNTNGPFASCDALSSVTGIGRATLEALRPNCTVAN